MRSAKSLAGCFLTSVVAASLLAVGCAPTSQAPAATTNPVVPTKAAESTKAPAAAPTVAKSTQYPVAGRTITIVVPWAAGGTNDITTRLLAPALEKELGVPVQIVNKAGAGSQTGLTELARSKPDGYTIGQTSMPALQAMYLDESRKAVFGRKDFQPIAVYGRQPMSISVKAGGPYKTAKDLVDAARAKPETVKIATAGLMSSTHTAPLLFQTAAGVQFAYVHFDGGSPAMTAVLGGHVDAQSSGVAAVLSQYKNKDINVLGILEKDRVDLYSELPTMAEQGYNSVQSMYLVLLMPAGAPPEVVDVLNRAVDRVLKQEDIQKKLEDMGAVPDYQDAKEFDALWTTMEEDMKVAIPLAK